MKKLVAAVLAMMLAVGAAGCGSKAGQGAPGSGDEMEKPPESQVVLVGPDKDDPVAGEVESSSPEARERAPARSQEVDPRMLPGYGQKLDSAPVMILPMDMFEGGEIVFDKAALPHRLQLNIEEFAMHIVGYYASGELPLPQYENSEPQWDAEWPAGIGPQDVLDHFDYDSVTIGEENEKYGGYEVHIPLDAGTSLVTIMVLQKGETDGECELVAVDGWFA